MTNDEIKVATQNNRIIHSKVYLLDRGLRRVQQITGRVLDGASFTNDSTSDIRRTCNISILVDSSSFDLLESSKEWFDKYYQVFIGIENNQKKIIYTNMGIYLVDNPSFIYSATDNTLTISGVDMMARMTGLRSGNLEGLDYQIKYDENSPTYIRNIMIDLIRECNRKPDGTYYNTPYSIVTPTDVAPKQADGVNSTAIDTICQDITINAGSTAYDMLTQLRDINANFQIYYDVNGVFTYNMIPSGNNCPIMVNDNVWKKTLISYQQDISYDNVKNVIEVYGKENDTGGQWRGYAWDNNPHSPFYVGYVRIVNGSPDYSYSNTHYDSSLGKNTTNYEDMIAHAPNIIRKVCSGGEYDDIVKVEGSTVNLAQDRAEYELYLNCKLQDSLTLTCVPIYWLDTNWLVEITLPNKNGTNETRQYITKSINTTLGVDATQSITLMRYYPLYDFDANVDI